MFDKLIEKVKAEPKKIVFTEGSDARIQEAVAYLMERWADKLDTFRACPRILDVHCKGVSKLRSARQLQKKLGLLLQKPKKLFIQIL